MATFINTFIMLLFFVFSLCYMYQAVYMLVVLVKDHKRKPRKLTGVPYHRFAVLIAGRNEEAVIGELIKSIKAQDYPEEYVDVFVVADNCTDNTAQVAEEAGAEVFVRNNQHLVGKSYALDFALNRIRVLYGDESGRSDYDAYIVFDADNIIDKNYMAAMNATFNEGYQVITCYRNSKNYDSNWISAGSGLWFMREAKFLSNARAMTGNSCAISGTGFLIDASILEANRGWIHHLLTEDIEFSTDCIAHGIRIGYCPDAYIYDEQPTTVRDSWNQRLRWAKGFYQVLLNYGDKLARGIFHGKTGKFSCFDMFMTVAPAMLLTIIGFGVNLVFFVVGSVQMASLAVSVQSVATGFTSLSGTGAGASWFSNVFGLMTGSLFQGDALSTFTTNDVATLAAYANARAAVVASVLSLGSCFLSFAGMMLVLGVITTITEWNHIHAKTSSKIKYIFTFPIFMLQYIPIAVQAVFSKVEWKPITHNVVRNVDDVLEQG